MKCVCGYEHDTSWDDDGNMKDIGDEEFIYISGHGLYIQGSGYYGDKKVELYACPKCKTLKIKT